MEETEWVRTILLPIIQKAISGMGGSGLDAVVGKSLPYSSAVMKYDKANKPQGLVTQSYQTDLLITETLDDGWIPRVVIETKLGGVTTHDAITYSQKALTHKSIHPYLRYGILVGNFGDSLPGRMIVHGSHFDFMAVWKKNEPDKKEAERITDIILAEIEASRQIEELIRTRRTKGKKAFSSLHRKLVLGT